jgi:hypothetical protein
MTMLLPTDNIDGQSRGNPEQFIRWIEKRGAIGPYREWVYEVADACLLARIDRCIVWFQGEYETNGFKNELWIRGNSGGTGLISDDGLTPLDFRDHDHPGRMAARVHVASLYAILGHTQFYVKLYRDMPKQARDWIDKLVNLAQNQRSRPPVRRVDDLRRRYRSNDGLTQVIWSWDEDYANNITARAMSSAVQIPSVRYLNKMKPFDIAKRFRVVLSAPVYEGPSMSENRLLDTAEPGQYIYFAGETVGHAAHGIPTWYYTPGPRFGFVHSGKVEPA